MFDAVKTKILDAKVATPVNAEESIELIPSKNGFAFAMKSARSCPICGNELDIPVAKPAIIFPAKVPIALPTCPKTVIPSLINQENPGI